MSLRWIVNYLQIDNLWLCLLFLNKIRNNWLPSFWIKKCLAPIVFFFHLTILYFFLTKMQMNPNWLVAFCSSGLNWDTCCSCPICIVSSSSWEKLERQTCTLNVLFSTARYTTHFFLYLILFSILVLLAFFFDEHHYWLWVCSSLILH